MSLNSAMYTQKINAGTVLQDFTAAAAVQQTPLNSTMPLPMLMTLAVRCRRSGLNVRS